MTSQQPGYFSTIFSDISDWKKGEEKIRESENRFQMIAGNVSDVIWLYNLATEKFSYISPSIEKQIGFTVEEATSHTFKDVLSPNDYKLIVQFLTENQNRISQNIFPPSMMKEVQLKHKDGRLVWVEFSAQFQKNSKEEIEIFGITRNIDKRKSAELELIEAKEKAEESENRFRTIAELSTEGITIADLEGNYIYVNKTFCDMSGYSREELLQMSVFDMAEPDAAYNSMDVYQSNENISGEKRSLILRKKDGMHYHTEITGTYIEIENQRLILGSVRDITEIVNYQNDLIAAKEKAEESDSRLKLAVDSGKLGIWDWNIKENTMVWNDRMFELYGIPKQTLLNSIETWKNGLHPDDKIKALRAVNKSLQHNKEFNTTFRIVRPDNSVLNIKANAIILRDKNDKPARMIGINRNITKSVKRETELIEAKDKALESDRLKSAFLMNMSHEIRTPLNGILGFVNLLQEPGMDEEDRLMFIDIINQSADRLLNTINDIIEISKIESGDLRVYYENIDISKLVQNHSDFFKLHAKEKEIELIVSNQIANGANLIQSDKQKLESILTNLIRNAIKFTEKGSVEIGSYLENSNLNLFVKDTGQGIPEDKLNIIFDPFVQADLALARRHEGSGIGLSIVKSYVEALNGTIQVESEVGQGTLFKISIPHIQAN